MPVRRPDQARPGRGPAPRWAAPVVLVPTMGALHQGHRALLRRARDIAGPDGSVVVSIFVNPLQFGAGEDFGPLPAHPGRGRARSAARRAPTWCSRRTARVMYPRRAADHRGPGADGAACWRARRGPGFFAGVLTVVLKLFQLVAPGRGGVRREGRAAAGAGPPDDRRLRPGHRDRRGAHRAGPGRAGHLQPERLPVRRRSGAPRCCCRRALRGRAGGGARRPGRGAEGGAARCSTRAAADPPLGLDYLALVDPATFQPVADDCTRPGAAAGRGRVGTTRLIDNTRWPRRP